MREKFVRHDNAFVRNEASNYGKDKCKKLKQIRKLIAEVNEIPFETVECYHEGPCPGTCPACDAEIKYLDEQLQQKRRRGEEVILSGLALDLVKSPDDKDDISKDTENNMFPVDGRDEPVQFVTMGQDEEYPFEEEDDEDPEEMVMGNLRNDDDFLQDEELPFN